MVAVVNQKGHFEMKRAARSFPVSSDDSSDSDSDDNTSINNGGKTQLPQSSKDFMSEAVIAKKKKHGGMDYEALSRHGYRGGPSVLKVPPPRVEEKEQDWSWSTGRENNAKGNTTEESYEDREHTRAALAQAEEKLASKIDKKNFSQKEKRKRDFGQASRGKNYVEEEKRLLRDSGIYSGFDS